MEGRFEEVARTGYMAHNGGFQLRRVSDSEFEFKALVQDYHLNSGGITHGGFITALMDSGLGTSVYRFLGGERRIATISLDVKFVAPSFKSETLLGSAKIVKKTSSMVFVRGELYVEGKVIATADGIWKILVSK